MFSLIKLALLVASAASLVSAGPLTVSSEALAAPDMSDLPPSAPATKYHDPESAKLFDSFENHLAARSVEDGTGAEGHINKRSGYLYCGNMASAGFNDGHSLMGDLINGGYNTPHTARARSCNRVGCRNTSGIYICNDNGYDITLPGYKIYPHVYNIINRCCDKNRLGSNDLHHQTGGQQFTNVEGGYNSIIAYANCNHPVNTPPSNYNGGRVNGMGCLPLVMYLG